MPVFSQNKRVILMYEREWQEMSLANVFLPHWETFSGIFIQDICISSRPLKVHPRAVLLGTFVKMYINMWLFWGTFSKNHEGCENDPIWPLCKVYVKLNVKDIVYKFIQQIYCIFLLENLGVWSHSLKFDHTTFTKQSWGGSVVESGPLSSVWSGPEALGVVRCLFCVNSDAWLPVSHRLFDTKTSDRARSVNTTESTHPLHHSDST